MAVANARGTRVRRRPMTDTARPKCKSCDKPLPRYPYRVGGPSPHKPSATWAPDPDDQWGGYGDNLFCGKTCGWRWAVAFWGEVLRGEAKVVMTR